MLPHDAEVVLHPYNVRKDSKEQGCIRSHVNQPVPHMLQLPACLTVWPIWTRSPFQARWNHPLQSNCRKSLQRLFVHPHELIWSTPLNWCAENLCLFLQGDVRWHLVEYPCNKREGIVQAWSQYFIEEAYLLMTKPIVPVCFKYSGKGSRKAIFWVSSYEKRTVESSCL